MTGIGGATPQRFKATMEYGPTHRVALIGGGRTLTRLCSILQVEEFDITVFASLRHREEKLTECGRTLQDLVCELGIEVRSPEDINDDPVFVEIGRTGGIALGFGEPWAFTANNISVYNGRLLDVMGIPLPEYRGGAHFSWMILTGHQQGAVNLQLITPEMRQGEFDNGEIVETFHYLFPSDARLPLDYMNCAEDHEVAVIANFLREAKAGTNRSTTTIDEANSLFMPRLHTLTHGWIDWSWTAHEIESFVCAFDKPYSGASTVLGECRVLLSDVACDDSQPDFHSFQAGLVYRVTDQGAWIAAKGGAVVVGSVRNADDAGHMPLTVGQRFVTPIENLQSARQTNVSYSLSGLVTDG